MDLMLPPGDKDEGFKDQIKSLTREDTKGNISNELRRE